MNDPSLQPGTQLWGDACVEPPEIHEAILWRAALVSIEGGDVWLQAVQAAAEVPFCGGPQGAAVEDADQEADAVRRPALPQPGNPGPLQVNASSCISLQHERLSSQPASSPGHGPVASQAVPFCGGM